MTVKEFRENYPKLRLETNLKHYKPEETKWGWFRTKTYPAECIIDAKILSLKNEVNGAAGEIISSGQSYNTKEDGYSDNEFLELAESKAIQNALDNLK